MIKGVGIDLLDYRRISRVYIRYGERFIDRILTTEEKEVFFNKKKQDRFLANNFCAKEAVAKALGSGIGKEFSFKDVSILRDEAGAPYAKFSDKTRQVLDARGVRQCLVSISDEKNYITAVAILS
jgi:holo-[acyl-carrier protein] synthase